MLHAFGHTWAVGGPRKGAGVSDMQPKPLVETWPKTLWKLVKNPSVEVAAAIVAVLLAAWVVIQWEVDQRPRKAPIVVPFALK